MKTFNVSVLGGTGELQDEFFSAGLSNPSGATIASGQDSVFIIRGD